MPHACQGLVRASGLPNADIHTPVRHGADAAGASKKEKKENTKVDIAAAATA